MTPLAPGPEPMAGTLLLPGRLARPLSLSRPTDHAPAVVAEDGEVLTHADVGARVDRLVRQLPDARAGRLLVHVPLRRRLADVVAYLATLEAGHVALVTDDDRSDRILDRYRPDVRVAGDGDGNGNGTFEVLRSRPGHVGHVLHPDLALLLSTSGSTGSPKLVRLSHRNLDANAAAIADALRLTADDRAITSLPLHYCFGLSVLHSHLSVGGSVVLQEGSVLDAGFWDAVHTHRVSTLAVVPHHVELMESSGVLERPHPSLRLVAQAGGRMAPARVARTAALGRQHGWDLAVMYGQTEATARICVLAPDLVAEHPDAVGRPVAGTTLRLDHAVPEAADGAGEVVVRGPGVMMGYAEHPDDLALGAMLTELRTGDLGRLDDQGLLRVVGRRSGFVKIMGLRVDLATVETALDVAGLTACVTGDDTGLRVAVEPAVGVSTVETAGLARRIAGETAGVGPAAVAVAVVPLARLDNGKVDRHGCDALVRGDHPEECGDARVRVAQSLGAHPTLATSVAAELGPLLGGDGVDLDRSFTEQGGDSLSHVQASVVLERLVGPLPRGWHHRPLGELVELGRQRRAVADPVSGVSTTATSRTDRRGLRTIETSVLLRAVAAVVICASHADLVHVLGGAHTLLAVAGFNAARFGLSVPTVSGRWRGVARMLIGIAAPTIAVAAVGMVTHDRYGWANLLLANWLLGDVTYGFHNELWFVDALAAGLVLLAGILSVPPIARAWRRDPWRVAVAAATLALVPRFVVLHEGEGVLRGIMPTTFWLVAVGAAAAHAGTRRRQLLTVAVAVLGGATFFADDPVRNATILGGVAALTLVPHVRVPARALPLIGLLAAASLHIYLVQFPILGAVPAPLWATLTAITVGCLLWRLTARPVRWLQDRVPLQARHADRHPA